jgi:hypothetical protein
MVLWKLLTGRKTELDTEIKLNMRMDGMYMNVDERSKMYEALINSFVLEKQEKAKVTHPRNESRYKARVKGKGTFEKNL